MKPISRKAWLSVAIANALVSIVLVSQAIRTDDMGLVLCAMACGIAIAAAIKEIQA